MRAIYTLLLAALTAGPALGQEFNIGKACFQGLRELPWVNSYDLLSEQEQFDEYRRRFCSMDRSSLQRFRQSSTSMGMNVPITEGITGLDGSDNQRTQSFETRIKAFCDQIGDVAQCRERFRLHSTTVSGDLATVAKHCMDTYAHVMIELNGNKPLMTISPQNGLGTFTASVYARSDRTEPVVIKTISPEAGLVRCVYGSQNVTPNFEVRENARFR